MLDVNVQHSNNRAHYSQKTQPKYFKLEIYYENEREKHREDAYLYT
jgi:hypothetical protein